MAPPVQAGGGLGVKQEAREGGGGGGGGLGEGDARYSRDTAMLQSMHQHYLGLHNIAAAATASYPLSLAGLHRGQAGGGQQGQTGGNNQQHLAAAGNYRPM